jgi:RND family efflux transporter MFP subunit
VTAPLAANHDTKKKRTEDLMTSRKTLSLVTLTVAGTLALAACGGGKKAGEAAAPAPVSAALAKAEARELPQRVELSGTVEAGKSAMVSSRVMASVVAVPVKEGDLVTPGQLLVEIDPQTAKGQESQARGALAQARAALALAERNYARFQALQRSGSASELELDMARMQYEQAKGAVEQATGAVEAASSVAKESRVVAPFAGRVARKMVDPGDLAAPGRPLVVVESTAGRRLVLMFPESVAVASKLRAGAKLPVTIDALPGRTFEGRVVEMSPGADPASHSFSAKVEVDADVPTGVAGRAVVETGRRTAIVIPAAAVLPQGGMSLVVVKDEAGKARTRAVTLGARAGDVVEVLSGLKGGEELLVGLAQAPADGAEVRGEVTR